MAYIHDRLLDWPYSVRSWMAPRSLLRMVSTPAIVYTEYPTWNIGVLSGGARKLCNDAVMIRCTTFAYYSKCKTRSLIQTTSYHFKFALRHIAAFLLANTCSLRLAETGRGVIKNCRRAQISMRCDATKLGMARVLKKKLCHFARSHFYLPRRDSGFTSSGKADSGNFSGLFWTRPQLNSLWWVPEYNSHEWVISCAYYGPTRRSVLLHP